MITLETLRENAAVNTYIAAADRSLAALGYTEHSFAHVLHVADTAGYMLHMPPQDIATVVTAIGNHDEGTGVPVDEVAAALILADKTDVRRSRVRNTDPATFDIHDRVNYSVKKSVLKINEEHTLVKLKLSIDTKYGTIMDYFEIFLERMILCRKAAEKLGLEFKLIINEQQLI